MTGRRKQGGHSLRRKAETKLRDIAEKHLDDSSDADMAELVHELQVHQFELEIQNEELRRTQEELSTSRQLFADLFHRAPVGYLVLDKTGSVQDVNETLCKLTDLPASKIKGSPVFDLIAEKDREWFIVRYKAIYKHPEGKNIELSLPTSAGETLPVSLNAAIYKHPEADSPGNSPLLLLTVTDISERLRAEQALQAQNDLLATIFESSPNILMLVNADGHIEKINRKGSEFSGSPQEKLIGLLWGEVFRCIDSFDGKGCGRNPDCVDCPVRTRMQQSLQQNKIILNEEGQLTVRKDTQEVVLDFLISTVPVSIVNEKKVLITIVDITTRKQAEEALRRYELLSEHSRDIILFMQQSDGRILEANAAAMQAYGYSRDELLALTIQDLRVHDTQSLTADQMAQANAGGILFETVHLRKDGNTFPVEVSSRGATIGGVRTLVSIVRDITERKRIEQEIANLSKFPTENPNPILRVQTDGKVIYANSASQELLELWDCEINGFIPENFKNLINAQVQSGSNRTVDIPCNDKVYSIMLAPILESGYVNLYASDITAHRLAERALLESEEKYRLLADNSNDWIYWIRPDGSFRYVSPSCERITGSTPLDFSTNPRLFTDIVHPEDRQRVKAHLNLASSERDTENLEYRIVTKAGEMRWINHSCAPLYTDTGEYIGRSGANRDITERKQAEVALRESEAFVTTVLDILPVGIAVNSVDPAVIFNYMNDNFPKFYRTTREKLADPDAFWNAVYEDSEFREEMKKRVLDDLASGNLERMYWVDVPITRKGEETAFITARNIPIPGRPFMISTVWDVTDRKRAEEELKRMMEELQHSNAELEQFAYVASHDLQEPLRGIAGLAQLLQHRYQSQLDSRADEYIEHIVEGTQRMQTLINDLLAYSRIGRRGEAIQTTDANAVLKATLENLSMAIREYGATVTNESLPTVQADSTQLTQLFQNLIGNAIKFRAEHPPEIHISATDAGEFWQFSVRDNGIGIEPQYFERIFQVFQRLHTRREYQGTGIGLAICKKIIERHGGKIWVESEFGQGSTFYFTLRKGK